MIEAFVTDTHPLLWFAADSRKKLGRKALAAFDAYQLGEASMHVPAPVVLETWFVARRGSIRVESTLARWWQKIASAQLRFEPMTAEDVFIAAELNWAHDDIYDRIIAATAIRLDLPLVTADAAITDWGGVKILW